MILVCKNIIPKSYLGITLFPFVILKYHDLKKDSAFINHEKIHLKQQLELLILPFYIVYGVEYLIRLYQYKNRYLAYRNISFECEAYKNESNLKYLNGRRFWAFFEVSSQL